MTRLVRCVIALPLLAASVLCAASAERRYTVLIANRKAGSQVCRTSGAETRCSFTYNDRGRGPAVEAAYTPGRDGLPARVTITGTNYLKDLVDERFTLEKGAAWWKSTVEAGERAAAGALYVPFEYVPEFDAVVSRAAKVAAGKPLALLPAGEIRFTGEAAVEASAEGRKEAVTRVDVSGLGLEESHAFLDAKGELFASGDSWIMTIREGWEAAAPALVESENAANAAASARRARELARRPAGALVFRGVTLFDADAAAMRPGTTVVVSGDRIAAVGPDGTVPLPAGAEIVDGAGKTLLPGLWDMHVHLTTDTDGVLDLASGITSVRDLGNDLDEIAAHRKRFAAGAALGPRILSSVLVDGPGPFTAPTKNIVSNEAEGKAAIEACLATGCTGVKIYSSVRPELVEGLVREAHARGLRASGHIPAGMTAEQAVRAGYDEIHHVNMLVLNFFPDVVKDTRTPARFTALRDLAPKLDLSSPRVRDFMRMLRVRGVVADPTLGAFESLFLDRPGVVPEGWATVADRLPPQVRRSLLAGGLPLGSGGEAEARATFDALLKMVARLHAAGVRIVAGTDGFAGFTLPRELELYVKAGIPAPEVLQLATIGAASVAHLSDELGSVAPGKKADLVLVAGNPAERISDVRNVVTVVKDGVVHDAAALWRSIGVRP